MNIPIGKNKLKALKIFEQRKFYAENGYPQDNIPEPIDLWYKKQGFGKQDQNGDSIFPSETFLKQLRGGDDVFVLNFVADAFEAFRDYLQPIINRQRNKETSIFAKIEPKIGWESANKKYHNYMTKLYESFAKIYLIKNNKENNLSNIFDFIKLFSNFINQITPTFFITRTAFIQTKFCTPMASGLMIEIDIQDHSDDENKYENFIQDYNFFLYTKTARKFGFIIDKNAPWRLIADISSPGMTPFLEKYELTPKILFQKQFYKAYTFELESLKLYLLQFYNSFVGSNPIIKETKLKKEKVVFTQQKRSVLTMEQMNVIFNDAFWLRFYAFIRAKEVDENFNQKGFNNFAKNIEQINKILGQEKAIEYLNKVLFKAPSFVLDRNLEMLQDKSAFLAPRKKQKFNLF